MTWSNGKGRGPKYAAEHQAERRARAATHDPNDPCVRCGAPLGPMGRNLHLDHAESGAYLGFSHGTCNIKAAAAKGAAVANRLAIDLAGSGHCSGCGQLFARRAGAQRFCSRECSQPVLARAAQRPIRVQLVPLRAAVAPLAPRVCPTCGAATLRRRYCSNACAAYQPRAGTPTTRTCQGCGESWQHVIPGSGRPPLWCPTCRPVPAGR